MKEKSEFDKFRDLVKVIVSVPKSKVIKPKKKKRTIKKRVVGASTI